jgi:elongation factor Ts
MAYSATDVKNLREQTGAGMMDCKKALDECAGNFDKAVDFLRAKGLAAAAKKQSRIAAEGLVHSLVNDKSGVLVEVNCETDFVAKNSDFQEFIQTVAKLALDNKTSDVEKILTLKTKTGLTVKDFVSELTIKIGEKIDFRRATMTTLTSHGVIGSYVHSGKIGVLVKVEADKDVSTNMDVKELAKDLCMQVVASDPKFLTANEIDEAFKAREAEIYTVQLKEQGKADNMIPNIVKGKLNKLASEVCIYEQAFVKDPEMTVSKLVETVGKKAGAALKITQFVRMNLGDGIEKKQDNFAEEVAKMTGIKN